MLRTLQTTQILSLFEAEQHVYSIPSSGTLASSQWARLTHERRVNLRQQAIGIWRKYLEEERIQPHPAVLIPEYRYMLTQPNGDMIIEEIG